HVGTIRPGDGSTVTPLSTRSCRARALVRPMFTTFTHDGDRLFTGVRSNVAESRATWDARPHNAAQRRPSTVDRTKRTVAATLVVGAASAAFAASAVGAVTGSGATFPHVAYENFCRDSGLCSYTAK